MVGKQGLQWVVAGHLQGFLNVADCLDVFLSGFRPGYQTKIDLVTLVDDLHQEISKGNTILLIVLAFLAIDHGILLDCHSGLELGGGVVLFHSSLNPTSKVGLRV